MAITDYIPNVFGSATPTTYEGLLGMGLITPEQMAQTKSTANIQGLLGAGLALAQGMSKIGPRRSAAENILGALAGGFGAAGGAYQQGLQNIVQQQQLQSAALTQQQAANRLKAIQQAKVTYPDLAPLADIDPGKFAEEVALRERVKGVSTTAEPNTPEGLQALAQKYYSAGPNFKALGDAYMEQAKQLRFQKLSNITGKESPSDLRNLANTAAAYGNKPLADQLNELASRKELEGPTAVPTAEVAAPEQVVPTDGTKVLPAETVVANRGRVGQIQLRIDNINSRIAKLTDIPTSAAKDEVAKLINVRDGLQKDVDRFSIMEYDFTPIEKLVPEQFKSRVRSLKNRAETGALSMAELSKEIADIENKSIEFVTKKTDFTNQDRRVFGGMFKNPDGSPRAIETASPIELMQLENKLYEMRIAEKRAGATTINMPTESERTAGFLTNRVVNSLNQLQTVVGAKPTAASPNFGAEAVKFLTGSEYLKNLANPEARQQVEAAQLEILDAALTLGTGAAYTREQLENYRRSYFPMLGDKPGTIQDKQNRLKSLIDSAMIKSGRAAPSMPSNIAPAFDLNAIQRELDRRKGK